MDQNGQVWTRIDKYRLLWNIIVHNGQDPKSFGHMSHWSMEDCSKHERSIAAGKGENMAGRRRPHHIAC
jgi:hypothetical protein